MPDESLVAIKVWDLPVRIFHWVLVLLLAIQLATGWVGGEVMWWHLYSGYAVLVLVVFRILWGFAGSTHARFASFLAGPAAGLRFAKRLFSREAVPQLGHNPLGGWMVIALIASLALQAVSGLFANDGVDTFGPLTKYVSLEVSDRLSQLHRWNLKLLVALSAAHVAGVVFHLVVKKENLVGAMFTGVKHVPEAVLHERREGQRDTPPRRVASREPASVHFASSWLAFAILAAGVVLVYLVVRH
ncbi:MAG: cytochrome b/b6 domain-containing protein [Usitatibacter sp.]